MMTCWFHRLESCSPTDRAIASAAPPAAEGTMMLTGLLGNVCADTPVMPAASAPSASVAASNLAIVPSPTSLRSRVFRHSAARTGLYATGPAVAAAVGIGYLGRNAD